MRRSPSDQDNIQVVCLGAAGGWDWHVLISFKIFISLRGFVGISSVTICACVSAWTRPTTDTELEMLVWKLQISCGLDTRIHENRMPHNIWHGWGLSTSKCSVCFVEIRHVCIFTAIYNRRRTSTQIADQLRFSVLVQIEAGSAPVPASP